VPARSALHLRGLGKTKTAEAPADRYSEERTG
jgi:hypothetical protein